MLKCLARLITKFSEIAFHSPSATPLRQILPLGYQNFSCSPPLKLFFKKVITSLTAFGSHRMCTNKMSRYQQDFSHSIQLFNVIQCSVRSSIQYIRRVLTSSQCKCVLVSENYNDINFTILVLNFQVAEEKLYEHWRKNEPRLRQVSNLFQVVFHVKRHCCHETALSQNSFSNSF